MQKDVWKLGERDGALIINWTLTLWCNYSCSYCRQSHQRENHAFDVYPVKQWIQVFVNLAPRRLALVITGGEPFLDRKPFRTLLDALSKMEHVDNVRIDTNGSWDADYFSRIDCSKFFLNVSYHPSMTDLDSLVKRVKTYLDMGAKVEMIDFVMAPQQVEEFFRCREYFLKLGIKTNPNPLMGSTVPYSREMLSLLGQYLHPFDLGFKTGAVSPKGKLCRFPAAGLLMDGKGNLKSCDDITVIGNLIKNGLPKMPQEPQPCKLNQCRCIIMYSCLLDSPRARNSLNILKDYVQQAILK